VKLLEAPERVRGVGPAGTVTITLALPAPSPVQTFTATVDASGVFFASIPVSGGVGIPGRGSRP
jgi:hypothetical protein